MLNPEDVSILDWERRSPQTYMADMQKEDAVPAKRKNNIQKRPTLRRSIVVPVVSRPPRYEDRHQLEIGLFETDD